MDIQSRVGNIEEYIEANVDREGEVDWTHLSMILREELIEMVNEVVQDAKDCVPDNSELELSEGARIAYMDSRRETLANLENLKIK